VIATSSIYASVEIKNKADSKKFVVALERAKEKRAKSKKIVFSRLVEEVKGEQIKDIFVN
jgi:transcriptional regulator of NAD metabolism